LLPASSGSATPSTSIHQVQREVDALNAKVDVAVEDYNQAKISLSNAARRTAAAQRQVAQAEAAIAKRRAVLGQIAASAYRSGGADQFLSLVTTSNPQSFLSRASSLNQITSHEADALRALKVSQLALDQARAVARQQLMAQRKVASELKAHKQAIERALAEQQHLLAGLQAAQRAHLAALAAAQARAARAQAVNLQASLPTYNGPASGRAAVAVKFAYAQLGKPYSWGASGPSSYDCSGLTMASWGAAGVSLPHSSAAQYGSGQHVSRSNIQPGDLVFFGSPIHHVGLYVGGGNMIDSPHTGDVVKVQAAFRSDYVGATRP
jgi:cell wall-associated NlpC family hydrolase